MSVLENWNYSQFASKPARTPYQLAPIPTRPNQLAPLISPTRPTSTTNSPRLSDQLAPAFTNSPHFSYQLAPLLLPTRTHVFADSPHFSDQVGWAY